MGQQTPIPPKSRMKPREGQKRAIFPSLIWGEGGSRFSIYFVQDCRFFVTGGIIASSEGTSLVRGIFPQKIFRFGGSETLFLVFVMRYVP